MLLHYAVKIFQAKKIQIEKYNCNRLSNIGKKARGSHMLQEAYVFEPTASDFEAKKNVSDSFFQRLNFTFLLERVRGENSEVF